MRLFRPLSKPKRASGSEPGLVHPSAWNAVLDIIDELEKRIQSLTPENSPDVKFQVSRDGFTARLVRKIRGGAANGPCPFGEIIQWQETEGETPVTKTGIRGGYVEAGNRIWNVQPKPVNLATPGEWIVWLRIEVTANTDATNSTTLSGLKTSLEPTWETESSSGQYEAKVIPEIFPEIDPGSGVAIIPIGVLTVLDGAASIVPTGCGHIIVDHCPGVLTHHRGPVEIVADSQSVAPP